MSGGQRKRGWLLEALVLISFPISACDEEADPPPQEGSVAALLEMLPPVEGIATVYAIDIERYRAVLGDDRKADLRVELASSQVLYYLIRPDSPIGREIDLEPATAAVNNGYQAGEGVVFIIATSQPFDQIALGLKRDGWVRRGPGVIEHPGEIQTEGASVIAAGDGVIALGFDVEVVRAAARGESGPIGEQVSDLIVELDDAVTRASAHTTDCIDAAAAGFDGRGGKGTLIFVTDDPDPDRTQLSPPGFFGFGYELKLSQAKADGDRLTVETKGGSPLGIINDPTAAYDCP